MSGRTQSVQDAPTTNDHDCKDAKPYKHTQLRTLRKENVIANIKNSSADKKQRGSII